MSDWVQKFGLQNVKVAAGVSGGADSLALLFRLKDCGIKVTALTVDHRLRPESSDEAAYVADLMKRAGIEHHVLIWDGDKPSSGVEEAARQARYDLLTSWCRSHDIDTLAMGHHRRDQAETFLLRLQRGSGLYGLSGMLPVSERQGIRLIRPQLDDSPDFLRDYLRRKGIVWVEDPSNRCEDFERVKIRHFLPELAARIGLTEARLAETAAVLARTRRYLEMQVDRFIKNHVRSWEDGLLFSVAPGQIASLHPELGYRVLSVLLKRAGQAVYPPEAEEILRLVDELHKPVFKGCTLGGCEIFLARRRLWVIPECRRRQVLSKSDWQKCLNFAPQYAKADLPYKVRRAMFNNWMSSDNGKNEKQ